MLAAGNGGHMKQKNTHNLKVYEAPGWARDIPRINLQGKWLSALGYNVGDHILVTIQDNRLIIEPAPILEAAPVK